MLKVHEIDVSGENNPKIAVYLSGSAFDFDSTDILNQDLPVILGKRIGEIESYASSQRFDDNEFIFDADNTGEAVLLLVVEAGAWEVSDVQTVTSAETGYTENYTRLRTETPVNHKSDNQASFKIEYYNVEGVKSKTISYTDNQVFEGGNKYIDGDFSMLTGSLYVADTLESGIDISGLKNTGFIRSLPYGGFNQATGSGSPGFLIFSGSALPNQSATTYEGVGLEMVADANNYFRFRTNPSILDIRTNTIFISGSSVNINTPNFFLGVEGGVYLSGSNGNIAISASNFSVTEAGNVSATDMTLNDYANADVFIYKIVKLTSTADLATYTETYEGDDGLWYTRLLLDGSNGGESASQIRLERQLPYPIGEFKPPLAYTGLAGTEITIEQAIGTNYIGRNVSGGTAGTYSYGFSSDEDDWYNQLWQTRELSVPLNSGTASVTYGTGTVDDFGQTSYSQGQGRTIRMNSGQRLKFVRSTFDYRITALTSYDWSNARGLTNIYSGIACTDGPIYIGGSATQAIHESASLQIDSTTKAFVPPKMTTTQMNNISVPSTASVVYDTTVDSLMGYNGTTWNYIGNPSIAFRAQQSATRDNQDLPDTTFTLIYMDDEIYDIGSNYNDTYTDSKFVAPFDGIYHFDCHILIDDVADWTSADRVDIRYYVNGSTYINTIPYISSHAAAQNNQFRGVMASADIPLDAGDYVQLYVYQATGNTLKTYPGVNWTWWNGHLVCRT